MTGRYRKVFVMGCGRSGTWLLAGVMATFAETALIEEESPVQRLDVPVPEGRVLVAKRYWDSYKTIADIGPDIAILYIVRHPYDVLTSHNPAVPQSPYHISAERWTEEMAALRALLTSGRSGTMVVRYEDLVSNPAQMQDDIAAWLGLTVTIIARDFHTVFRDRPGTHRAMHGLRAIDANSVGRWRTRPEHLLHLRSIRPQLDSQLGWVAEAFTYDCGLG